MEESTYTIAVIVRALNVREVFTVTAPREGLAKTRAIATYLKGPTVHPNFSGSFVEYEILKVTE